MSTWHAPPDLLDRYARQPEAIGDTTASSIEQHLLSCAACRAAVAAAEAPFELEESWAAIADVIDRPSPALLERLLTRAGVAADAARLVGATGAMRLAWLVVVLGLAAGALLVSDSRGDAAPFLVLAPLLPVGAVALAFLPVADPAGEAGVATPLHGVGVAVRRVLVTAGPTLAILALASPALPADLAASAAWLLPALALSLLCLLLATFLRVSLAVAASSLVWITAVWLVRAAQRGVPFPDSAAFDTSGQLVALLVAMVSLGALAVRRDRFATMEVTW